MPTDFWVQLQFVGKVADNKPQDVEPQAATGQFNYAFDTCWRVFGVQASNNIFWDARLLAVPHRAARLRNQAHRRRRAGHDHSSAPWR